MVYTCETFKTQYDIELNYKLIVNKHNITNLYPHKILHYLHRIYV